MQLNTAPAVLTLQDTQQCPTTLMSSCCITF